MGTSELPEPNRRCGCCAVQCSFVGVYVVYTGGARWLTAARPAPRSAAVNASRLRMQRPLGFRSAYA
jgi:hypothetical protein